MPWHRRRSPRSWKTAARQRGVVLLLVMLLLVSVSSYIFLKKLNQQAQQSYRDEVTAVSLARAKEALLGYAATYPELVSPSSSTIGPGYLPCPDTTNSGSPVGSCSMVTATAVGLLPWRYLGLPDLRDGAGERLWYAVDNNHRYKNYQVPLNSEIPGQLTVDGGSDIVAIIIAPGPAFADQNRAAGPTPANISNYLECANATLETSNPLFVTRANCDRNGDGNIDSLDNPLFNDRAVTITRQELMAAVEKRVMGEVAKAMQAYRSGGGSYPWLTPYADPKVMTPSLISTATAPTPVLPALPPCNNLQLTDSSVSFTAWGVAVNDLIRDLTDGSVGRITGLTANTITVASLTGGTNNCFALNDSYQIIPISSSAANQYSGTASAGSSGLTLADTTKDFNDSAVKVGDVIDDVTDGSHGVINGVNNTSLTVQSLQGGTANTFNPGDSYVIRTDTAAVTSGGPSTTVTDVNRNYNRMGISANDLVQDTTTGSFGLISAVSSTSFSAGGGLNYGQSGNSNFSNNDVYRLARYNPNSNVNAREGLLPLQEIGKPFRSSFTTTWDLSTSGLTPAMNVYVTGTTPATTPETNYVTAATNFALSSTTYGPISVADTEGVCVWTSLTEAECKGRKPAAAFISGTAGAGSGPNTLVDATRVFDSNSATPDWGVRVGAQIKNITTGITGIVTATFSSGSGGANTLTATNDFNAGDAYQVFVPTRQESGTMDPTTFFGIPYITIASASDPLLTETVSNDSIQDVTTGTVGSFTSFVSCASIFGILCPANSYFVNATISPNANDSFIIRSGYVSTREYQLQIRYRGIATTTYSGGERLRTVTTTAGTITAPVEAALGTTPVIHIIDRDATNNVLADTTVSISDKVTGTMSTSGIRYPLLTDGTTNALPAWFVPNRWQRTMYAAEATGFAPGGAGTCTAGTDCLTVTHTDTGRVQNDVQAIVVSAGPALSTQDRSLGCSPDCATLMQKYFEGQNFTTGDDNFQTGSATSSFNDQIRVIAP